MLKETNIFEIKNLEKIFPAISNHKTARVGILMPDTTESKKKDMTKNKEEQKSEGINMR